MIYTVTFNPSLDYIVSVPGFELGKTNRTVYEQMLAGGKGINVTTVLTNLGIDSTALGFVAGFTGDELIRRMNEMGLRNDFIRISNGFSRINLKLRDIDGTEINGMGPVIDQAGQDALMAKLNTLTEGDTLVLAGSIPESMPGTIYSNILEALQGRGIRFVVDATKDLLLNVLQYHPFLIKPNHHEIGEIFGVELDTRESVVPYARKLREMGAVNVLVSMSGKGAVLVDENDEVHALPAPEGKLVNAVGAGDSMVAGFLTGWEEQHDYEHAFRMGVATGSASAFSDLLATRPEVMDVYGRLDG
ncbi:MAG: 1-phosphofructokinase [Lachnospiraceae bacterium]|nr:1-phosphofructokinase [Sarcina sp.]MBQ6590001.1 1-phosphofructokinase [Lachnospiraceae bacterium]